MNWNFPGSPAVKTLPSNAGGVGSVPGRGAKVPHTFRPIRLLSFETLGIVTWPKWSQWGHYDPIKTFWLVQPEKRHAFSFLLKLELWEFKTSISRSHLVAGGSYLSVNGTSTRGMQTWNMEGCTVPMALFELLPMSPFVFIYLTMTGFSCGMQDH